MSTHKTPFWLVWNPDGRSPTVKHMTESAAVTEAMRLAVAAPGQEFYVLQPLLKAVRKNMEITRFDEIPF